jgi:hypothetical protein
MVQNYRIQRQQIVIQWSEYRIVMEVSQGS